MERRPALQKRKMLPHVKAMLIKHDLMEAVIGKLILPIKIFRVVLVIVEMKYEHFVSIRAKLRVLPQIKCSKRSYSTLLKCFIWVLRIF